MQIGSIQRGMDVYDADGDLIGYVDTFWPPADSTEQTASARDAASGSGSQSQAATSAPTTAGPETGWFRVEHVERLEHPLVPLYVPFSAIQSVESGRSITLNCAVGDCVSRYSVAPPFLENT